MRFDDSDTLLQTCVERLGEKAGRQFAALARRGFCLERATDDAPATGRCRLGGPALLEPATPWPEAAGFPLSLFAVLDTDALAPWLGDDLPIRPGLLNFFYFEIDLPSDEYWKLYSAGKLDAAREAACVIPADPARAVERAAPASAKRFPSTPVRAAEAVMLPDVWDAVNDDIEYDQDRHWGATSLLLDKMGDLDGNTMNEHCAFGWPDTSYTIAVTSRDDEGRPDVHLLQLAEDEELGVIWGEAGTVYFTIPWKAFEAGDFTQADAQGYCA